ncbi:Ecm5 protein [Candida orthopsilosis Co 90-125]|uniref:Ecm5 protein n=1 Tax=Candida orthopsilosis (strain 90-125) TaxID=1136231 RepID=H8X061_CANO9|nr:Ecm5 protein [Candida orthopsilosis Co 90-125]CCG22573.1 Ecm5 protein [Candida orthopsilosis Co 90-125]
MTLYSEESGSPSIPHNLHRHLSTTIPSQTSTFPKSSRFFDTSTLPDLKHLEVSDEEHHQVLFNGQLSNFNYSPFNISQQKSKASPPIHYGSIPNKFFIVPFHHQEDNEIPFLHINEEIAKDPISLVDSLSELGKKYGAVKVKLPVKDEALFQTTNQVNSDLFWFHTDKLLNNPKNDELIVRLKFHRDLLEFHQSDQYHYFEDPETRRPKDKNGTNNLQFHLSKLPMIDKRPLDLYKLYQSVIVRGGFIEVINKKLWAQIGRELGYKGKIMTSLSSSLKASYQKILYPYELYVANRNMGMVKEEQTMETLSPSGKRNLQPLDMSEKKIKVDNRYYAPIIVGSAKQFKRQFRTKVSKGILANSPHLIDVKQPNTYVIKQNDKKRNKRAMDIVNAFITPQALLFASSSYIRDHQDGSSLTEVPKIASSYTLRQFMEKDIKFQEYIVQQNKDLFRADPGQRDCIGFKELESLYWRYIRNQDVDSVFSNGIELEMGKDLPSSVHGSGFVRIGDDMSNFKNALNNHQLSLSHAKQAVNAKNPNTTPHGFSHQNPWEYNQATSIDRTMESALYPWNLHNFSTLPNAILGTLNESDIGNQELTETRVNVGMTFSTENWTCEDHFTQLINYHFFGAPKRWYFIPESEFEKFEQLVRDATHDVMLASTVNHDEPVDMDKVCAALFRSNCDEIDTDLIIKSLENSVNAKSDVNLQHGNAKLDAICQHKEFKYNQDLRITPELLEKNNIRYTTTVQNPGEFIIKFPKTYSSAQSYGFNFTEETNFASSLWLDYAIEGENWLSKQGILPNFSVFKLLVTVAMIYDNGGYISFNSDVFARVASLYEALYLREIELRDKIRKLKIKETSVVEESLSDIIADDDHSSIFPSRVMITEIDSKDSMLISMESFLKYLDSPDFMDKFQVELQLFHSDDKLKSYFKILNEYSVNFESWIRNYETMMAQDSEITLKQYKILLNEGDKINSSIFSTAAAGEQPYDQHRLNLFGEYLNNLRHFTSSATQFIEDCQNILSLKHQQRIRNGQDSSSQERAFSLNELTSIVEKIPSLNFTCPEIDQILELKTEIENFDKASRSLISKKNRSLQEFDDLISLGESFGLDIPSLDFIIRIRDRLRWIKTYNLIEKGVDPYADKKEVFSIGHLKEFYNTGLKLLAEGDLEYIKSIETVLNQSIVFNNDVKRFLQYTYVHDLDLDKLKSIVDNFTQEKLFISSENYTVLSKIHTNMKLISSFKEKQKANQSTYHELKQLYNAIIDSGLEFETSKIQEALIETESWTGIQWSKFNNVKILTTMTNLVTDDNINPKLTLHTKLMEKLQWLLYKSEYNLSSDDKFEESSSFSSHQEEHDDPKFYCVCREYEHGTMVECEQCREWYHVQCVKDISNPKEDIYKCPVCLLLSSGQDKDRYLASKLTLNEVMDIYRVGKALKAAPVNETTVMGDLIELLKSYRDYIKLGEILNESNDQIRLEKLIFIVRKLYGCGLFIDDLYMEVLQHAKLAQKIILGEGKQNEPSVVATASGDETEPEFENGTNDVFEQESVGQRDLLTVEPTANGQFAKDSNGIDRSHLNEVVPENGTIDDKSNKQLNFVFYAPNETTHESTIQNGVYSVPTDQLSSQAVPPITSSDDYSEATNHTSTSLAPVEVKRNHHLEISRDGSVPEVSGSPKIEEPNQTLPKPGSGKHSFCKEVVLNGVVRNNGSENSDNSMNNHVSVSKDPEIKSGPDEKVDSIVSH